MDFTPSEAQDELAGLARKILAEQEHPRADLAAAGVLAAGLPTSLGGAGLGLLDHCSVLAEIGRAVSDVPYLASIVLGAGAIAEFGSPSQRARWAAPAGIDMSYPVHRYFVAAKHHEFALGGATAQLRRIGAALARALPSGTC